MEIGSASKRIKRPRPDNEEEPRSPALGFAFRFDEKLRNKFLKSSVVKAHLKLVSKGEDNRGDSFQMCKYEFARLFYNEGSAPTEIANRGFDPRTSVRAILQEKTPSYAQC
ncbi:hypothetical protein AJ80_09292 [Polytolypa hystricis UAMH7299]|uniref:Uncharacterized protein n=1 Tax=Polytolypa hystricis (strain UAMH7299) TaxID=1447883 RepID=A0A2B7WT83_POLH7|nr:hypothetical protein AJ80_09292 [Polytolypa hystricis UAMH7299]